MTHPPYQDRIVTAEKALSVLESGDRIYLGSNCAMPKALVRELNKRHESLNDVEIVHILTAAPEDFASQISPNKFRHKTFFVGKDTRQAVAEGKADYIPVFLSEIPGLFYRGQMSIDISMIQVSPPDKHGFCSYGIGVDISKAATECADIVIAQVNACMPRCLGDSFVHVNDIDYLVYADEEIDEAIYPEPDEISKKIGYLAATLIENESTLQMGIGGIPNAVLANLREHKNLGIHTEMFSDGVMELVESGVITNDKKSLHNGKIITSFCMGSRALYDFVDDNPLIEFHPSDYVNNPVVISKNYKMTSINSAIEIDLSGQVCADSIGTRIYSGIGGQVDFIRGAAMARKGKSILAMPSTAKGGTVSRINAILTPGAGVVTSRGDVHYVVTEYGIAHLHGRSIRERSIALINIAHPDFRAQIYEEAIQLGILHANSVSPFNKTSYPVHYERKRTFENIATQFRPVKPTDVRMLQEFFYEHERNGDGIPQYLSQKGSMHEDEAMRMCSIDYDTEMCMLVTQREGEKGERIIGLARYLKDPARHYATCLLVVHREMRHHGLGKALLKEITEIAQCHGIKGFIGFVQKNDVAMMKMLHHVLTAEQKSKVRLIDDRYRYKYLFPRKRDTMRMAKK